MLKYDIKETYKLYRFGDNGNQLKIMTKNQKQMN